jgi:hypothetical protein
MVFLSEKLNELGLAGQGPLGLGAPGALRRNQT